MVIGQSSNESPRSRLREIDPKEIKRAFLKHPGAQGVYFQGGKLRILDIIEELEEDLQVPVVHPVVAQCWEIQKRLHVRQPKKGYGRLLAEMP